MFTGFPEETLRFFLDLRYHNSGEWFHSHREQYERDVRAPFYAFIEDMLPTLLEIDGDMERRPHKCLSRINRDTRFSRDKSPYRDHLWVWFHRAAEARDRSVGFWFELGPDGVGWGLGTWDENRPMMDCLRRKIAADPARISGILSSCGLPERHLHAELRTFKRLEIPPGVPDHLRSWYAIRTLYLYQTRADMAETASDALLRHVAADYLACAPIYRLLRGCADEAEPPAEEDSAGLLRRARREDEW